MEEVESIKRKNKNKVSAYFTKIFYHLTLKKFIILSLIGIFLFMIPIKIDSDITIPIAFLSSQINGMIVDYIPFIKTYFIIISVIGSLLEIIDETEFYFQK
ncbi:hypothetical protein ABET51_14790 [Metabacillus fastidiosus]|uniref:hypothetical protein n=2 Tax=Metabacillus fastidiosus TaxID=1458 RepID=UPI003D2D7A0B